MWGHSQHWSLMYIPRNVRGNPVFGLSCIQGPNDFTHILQDHFTGTGTSYSAIDATIKHMGKIMCMHTSYCNTQTQGGQQNISRWMRPRDEAPMWASHDLGLTLIFVLHDDVIKWIRNIFRVTGPLRRGFTGHRWIPLTKASDAELWCFLWSASWISGWINNREAGDFLDAIVLIMTSL